ncbi:MAG: hypothetical protein Q7J28_04525 [Caulobacter sp.]|nr:hypothetical protein [Caulobacter sp.]
MMDCLDKAAEMDRCAAQCRAPEMREARAQFLELGRRWRDLAVRALRQDQSAFGQRGGPTST